MRIAGVDPDSKSITIFIAEATGHDAEMFDNLRLEAKGRRAEDRFQRLVEEMRGNLPHNLFRACNYVYVERPFVGPNRKGAMDVGMVVGALRAELYRLDVPHSLVDPAVWKTRTLGTSRVSKEEIKQWAMVRFGLEDGLVQDVYDAAGIAAFGLSVLAGGGKHRETP